MIDIEGLATGPEATILTIAAQGFDPLRSGYFEQHQYYARITLELTGGPPKKKHR